MASWPDIHAVSRDEVVTPRALRLYEEYGLLRPVRLGVKRIDRYYPPLEIARLRLIRRGAAAGLTLRQIKAALVDSPDGLGASLTLASDLHRIRGLSDEAYRNAVWFRQAAVLMEQSPDQPVSVPEPLP